MKGVKIPEREIKFAAKTGFLSQQLWNEYFAKGSASWRRRQWRLFIQRGFFRHHPSALAKEILILNRRNLDVLNTVGDEISTAPYISQLEHDKTMAHFLLELLRNGVIESFTTEMEQKRALCGERRLNYGPSSIKYPDAIVTIKGKNHSLNLALELELTRKDPRRYRHCLDSYTSRRDIDRVVFIARSEVIFDSLRRAIRETFYPDWERPIGFSHIDEWKTDPTTAAIRFAEKQTTIESIRKELIT